MPVMAGSILISRRSIRASMIVVDALKGYAFGRSSSIIWNVNKSPGAKLIIEMQPNTVRTAKALQDKINARTARVGVVGLGYVGLPLAMEFARAGFEVTGIDILESK